MQKKHPMFIRHQIPWTIRVIKNTSLRSIRWVYTEWKQTWELDIGIKKKTTTPQWQCCDQWSHRPWPHTHVSEFDLCLFEKECWPCSSHEKGQRTWALPGCTQGQFEFKIAICRYPNIVWWVNKKCDPLPDLGEDCKSAARPHLHQ